ncbi:MAG: hypothetical protein LAT65_15740 [Saccharospirillum sp.]|nr:hypothetical protein [Saccharospirillum sp.]
MIMQYIADTYGSKKGFLRHIVTQTLYRLGCYRKFTHVPENIERIVFVCQGNICRSALAEWAFKLESNFPVASIGLETHTGKPAYNRMIKLADENGIDLNRHTTTSIENFTIKSSDLLVCMELRQVEILKALNYEQAAKLLLGTLLRPPKITINDPYLANDTYMAQCLIDIKTSVKALAEIYKG